MKMEQICFGRLNDFGYEPIPNNAIFTYIEKNLKKCNLLIYIYIYIYIYTERERERERE